MPMQLAAGVDQRAARVSRVDGGVGLDEVFVGGDTEIVTADGAHDPERDRMAELERVANGQHPLGDLQPRRVAPSDGREAQRESSPFLVETLYGS